MIPMVPGEGGWRTWLRDDPRVREALRRGEAVEVEPTGYGGNDFLLEFLMASGLWELLCSVRPRGLRKDNGKPWRALNGLEVLRELTRVDRVAACGRVIRDTRLMMIAGFNAEALTRARRRGGLVVTPQTLGNHLGRIHPREVVEAFYGHLALLRGKGWLKRGVYAADAHEITFPHARGWPGMGKVGEAHGYKLVLLVRTGPGRERIAGFALGPLQTSEHLLLRMMLRELERRVCPVRRLIDVLVLDRGYWGAEFLLGLRRRHGVHFVTRAQHEGLGLVQDVEGMLRDEQDPDGCVRVGEDRARLGPIEVRLRGLSSIPLHGGRGEKVGEANVVVADEYDLRGGRLRDPDGTERPRFYYVTDLPVQGDPYSIRGHYRRRWTVENQGFRNLTQRWGLDVPAGRGLHPLLARLLFVLVLANAEMIVEELFPDRWQQERQRLGRLGVPGRIGGDPALAAYTDQGQLGLLSVQDYRELLLQAERDRVARDIRTALARGESPQAVLKRLAKERPDTP